MGTTVYAVAPVNLYSIFLLLISKLCLNKLAVQSGNICD